MNLNTRAAFILTKATSPHLTTSKGNIVHVSSVAGLRQFPNMSAYCVSKAAMDQLVRWEQSTDQELQRRFDNLDRIFPTDDRLQIHLNKCNIPGHILSKDGGTFISTATREGVIRQKAYRASETQILLIDFNGIQKVLSMQVFSSGPCQ